MTDELPAWFWVPSAVILWSVWLGLKIGDARDRLKRMADDVDRVSRANHENGGNER